MGDDMGALEQASLPVINRTRLDDVCEELKGLKKVIEGDNGDGLKTKVGKLQDRVELILKVMWLIFGAVVIQIVATLWVR